jgi:GST-like protein
MTSPPSIRYTIWGAPGSGSGIVEAACAELGVDYEWRDLDARSNEHRGAKYGALNPHRKIPTLEFGNEVITESVAILLTLDERHPDGGLLPPAGTRERAQALRWMLFLATEIYPLVELDDYPERFVNFSSDMETAASLREHARARKRERWKIVENFIVGPYLLGNRFTATDLYITKLAVWEDLAFRRESIPKIHTLTTTVRARPKLAPVWARHIP